jgi:hypothetical protein
METFTGKPAGTLRIRDFWALFVSERRQMGHYLRWLGELRELANERKRS